MSEPEYVIWSMEHNAWWRPGWLGYSATIVGAGRYSEREARAILERANYPPGICHEAMIPVEAVRWHPPTSVEGEIEVVAFNLATPGADVHALLRRFAAWLINLGVPYDH